MNNLPDLTNRINSFDNYYMMSDDHSVWEKWNREEKAIKYELELLSDEDKKTVFAGLDKFGIANDFGKALELEIKLMAKEESTHSKVMKAAWAMLKGGLFTTISEALKAAWKSIKLKAELIKGVAYFKYIKADGTIRNAIGTLAKNNFTYKPKGATTIPKPSVIKYYDIEKRSFRSVRVDRLIELAA